MSLQVARGNKVIDGIIDNAYDTGPLTLSSFAQNVANTDCKKCYQGIVSAGDGSNPAEREEILETIKSNTPYVDLAGGSFTTYEDGHPVSSPYVLGAPDGRKQDVVADIQKLYNDRLHAKKQGPIPNNKVYFFDDKSTNILPFKDTGYNAKQISCSSRDPNIKGVGLCGATPDEVNTKFTGVHVCKYK